MRASTERKGPPTFCNGKGYQPSGPGEMWMAPTSPWRDCRIYLHRIYPCAPGEALFHPHLWPSAMRILSGEYEMAVGYGAGRVPRPRRP